MASVAVIGGGMAGLTAAFRLKAKGYDVTVFEAAAVPGGVIQSVQRDGYLVEYGPNALQTSSPALDILIAEAGLEGEVVDANPAARRRYVVQAGRPVALPTSPPALLNTSLVSWRARLRLLREPLVRPAPPEAEETVAAFVRRRLGPDWLAYVADPFVAGVFAGDPSRLALRHAFPRVHALEQTHGSLLLGQLRASRAGGAARRMVSFRQGLHMLPTALARPLGDHLRLNTRVTALQPDGKAWQVTADGHEGRRETRFDAVVTALPLPRLAPLLAPAAGDVGAFTEVVHPPVRIVALGYPRPAVAHPLDGFGMLVPSAEGTFRILGTLFSSTLFPGRAPAGHVLLTTFVGGTRHPALALSDAATVQRVVEDDLGRLLGIQGGPSFVCHVQWPQAIPQYDVGYGAVKALADRLEQAHPGLALAGSFRQGVSVGDTVASGAAAAARIHAFLS